MYPNPVFLMGDEHCTLLNQTPGCLTEGALFYPYIAAQQCNALTIINQMASWVTPLTMPWFVFSVGTWDGHYDYFGHYNQIRSWVGNTYRGTRKSPKCIWLAPVNNQSSAFNVIRCARGNRDQFLYVNNGHFPIAADGIHLTNPGYVALGQYLRYTTRCWTL